MEPMFPLEIFVRIFNYAELKDLVKMGQLSHQFKNLVREICWPHLVGIQKLEIIKYVLENYRFMNYDFTSTPITDAELQHLDHCQTLNLSLCHQITDAGLQHLGSCQTLNLGYCNKITDAMCQQLKKTVKRLII